MKSKSRGNKLLLNKRSIANLNHREMLNLRSGDGPQAELNPNIPKRETAISYCSCPTPIPTDFGIPTHD